MDDLKAGKAHRKKTEQAQKKQQPAAAIKRRDAQQIAAAMSAMRKTVFGMALNDKALDVLATVATIAIKEWGDKP